MHILFRAAKGTLHQTLIADFSVADAYRSYRDGAPSHTRLLIRAAAFLWKGASALFGEATGLWISGVIWTLVGLPAMCLAALRLEDAYRFQGDDDASILLLRTGVANEALIARWAETRHGAPVAMLQRNDKPAWRLSGIVHMPSLLRRYVALNHAALRALRELRTEQSIPPDVFSALVPSWMALLCRRSGDIAWAHQWATRFVAPRNIAHLYFTMNYAMENAFRTALPDTPCAYVEHGFPRRDIPPLACKQYVYSEKYAAYLRSFASGIETEIIGLDYFPSEPVAGNRTIVVASLQDWPAFKVSSVAERFNAALSEARAQNWRIVLRTRTYGADAFAEALDGPWDEISEASQETFFECLTRVRPAMVWTTWSTAMLDANARGVEAVAFVTPALDAHFIVDIDRFALRVMPDGTGWDALAPRLRAAV